ncbi:Uncharacterised protein [[Clostridium] sordellii]|uniref:hypothetical protein n=1 Tax=Paraclostridium sordellii TaxID=1505 RepID=UPI0005E2F3E1|nr:hypothetical protein [Paeniclostridium sordellii]CEQ22596.1 Uncharacterised protein [[Clostridium] sordellii] [Paeniclostridium sordellii]
MISNKLTMLLSGAALILYIYIFIINDRSSFNTLNIGLFIIFLASFINSLISLIKIKKEK